MKIKKIDFWLNNKKYNSFFDTKDVIKVFKQYNRTMWNGECVYDSSLNEYTYSGLIKFKESELKVKPMDKTELFLNEIKNMFNNRMDNLESTINQLNNRMDNLESSINQLNNRMDNLEKSMNQLNKRVDNMEISLNNRLDKIENRLDKIENCPTIQKELN